MPRADMFAWLKKIRPKCILSGKTSAWRVRATLHGGIVRYDHTLYTLHPADAGYDAGRVDHILTVHVVCGQRGQLQERRARIDQQIDTITRQQFALGRVSLDRFRSTARKHLL
uniref:Uncharacterized protein n=1 Tax=Anopheles epiroticus TaxID=199890 RepID=A0A182P506_9DIPT